MTWLLAPLGHLADTHPRAVFAVALFFGTIAALSLAMGLVLWAARRMSDSDERAEGL